MTTETHTITKKTQNDLSDKKYTQNDEKRNNQQTQKEL